MPFSKDEKSQLDRHSGYPDKCFLICNETKSFTFQGMIFVGGHVDIVCAVHQIMSKSRNLQVLMPLSKKTKRIGLCKRRIIRQKSQKFKVRKKNCVHLTKGIKRKT